MVQEKKCEPKDGLTIKYHANGISIWSKGMIEFGQPEGYWEWYRTEGTLKRSGYFSKERQIRAWITHDDARTH